MELNIERQGIMMKTWKVLKGLTHVVAYVEVAENCKIYDTAYATLQLVRSQFPEDRSINGTQLLDVARGETMQENIPVYQLA